MEEYVTLDEAARLEEVQYEDMKLKGFRERKGKKYITKTMKDRK